MIFAAALFTFIDFNMVAPSLVMRSEPFVVVTYSDELIYSNTFWMILSESGLDEIGDGGGSDEGVHAGIRPLVSEDEWRGGNLVDDRFVLQDCCLVG